MRRTVAVINGQDEPTAYLATLDNKVSRWYSLSEDEVYLLEKSGSKEDFVLLPQGLCLDIIQYDLSSVYNCGSVGNIAYYFGYSEEYEDCFYEDEPDTLALIRLVELFSVLLGIVLKMPNVRQIDCQTYDN